MKKIYILLPVLLVNIFCLGQTPEKMTFQAVIRDASNTLLTNQNIGMQVSIVQGSVTGNAIYSETHTPMSNYNGLVNLEIGAGTAISGNFSSKIGVTDLFSSRQKRTQMEGILIQ